MEAVADANLYTIEVWHLTLGPFSRVTSRQKLASRQKSTISKYPAHWSIIISSCSLLSSAVVWSLHLYTSSSLIISSLYQLTDPSIQGRHWIARMLNFIWWNDGSSPTSGQRMGAKIPEICPDAECVDPESGLQTQLASCRHLAIWNSTKGFKSRMINYFAVSTSFPNTAKTTPTLRKIANSFVPEV